MNNTSNASESKLLLKVAEALDDYDCKNEHADWTDISIVAIDAIAEWFDEVLDVVGIMPSSIPSLLHWQAHAHEHSFPSGPRSNAMDDETL